MRPINHHADSSESVFVEVKNKIEDNNPDSEQEITENVYPVSEKTNTNTEPLETVEEVDQPIAKRLRNNEHKDEKEIFNEYSSWKANRRLSKVKIKSTSAGKNWIKISKKNIFSLLRIQLPDFDEEKWMKLRYIKLKHFIASKNWKILKFHMEDSLITNTQRLHIRDLLNFLLQTKFMEHDFFLCERPDKLLNEEEKNHLLREAHDNVATGHFGENKTIKRLREQTYWEDMEKDVIEFIKKCKTCQQEKLKRIRPKLPAVIPEIPTELNEKIVMDIVGPLGETQAGNNYILSIQDVLTKYIIFIPLKEISSESLLAYLLYHYIYIFSAPKHILTDQGASFVSELVQKFENLVKIKHVKTTAFQPQSNKAIERTHGTIKELLKT